MDVLGVDACRGGWVGMLLTAGSPVPLPLHSATIRDLVEDAALRAPRLAVVAIDIPIGLDDHGPRDADLLVRSELGARGPHCS